MATNIAQIAQLMRPGLNAVIGLYDQYPDEYKEIFKTYKSDQFQEIDVEMKYLGAAMVVPEGQPIPSDSFGQRVVTNYVHRKVGVLAVFTREAVDDNRYKTQFPQQMMSMTSSLRTAKNTLGANVLNNAFDPIYTIGDGQSVCSLNHPVDGGVYANTTPVPIALSQAGLEAAILGIQSFVMQSGILCNTMPLKMIIPKEQQFVATALLNSAFRVDTANNDINAIYHNNYFPQGYKINHYLTSSKNYFVITDAPEGLKHFERQKPEAGTQVDFLTNNIMFKITERYSFGVTNPRGIFGIQG